MGEERNDLITMVDHDDDDSGAIIIWKEKGHDIKWKGLYDKNSDKLYAPKQLLPQSDYNAGHKEIFERHASKYRKLQKKGLSEIF